MQRSTITLDSTEYQIEHEGDTILRVCLVVDIREYITPELLRKLQREIYELGREHGRPHY